jgi:DNA-binding NarL/FixJ family response regulator
LTSEAKACRSLTEIPRTSHDQPKMGEQSLYAVCPPHHIERSYRRLRTFSAIRFSREMICPKSAMPPSERTIRIVLADDHPIFREGLRKLLSTCNDFAVIGEASNGSECLRLLLDLKPDILLLDLRMPEKNGVEVLEHADLRNLPTGVIVLTAIEDNRELVWAMCLGARGIVSKRSPCQSILESIRKVYEGEIWLDNCLNPEVLGALRKWSEAGKYRAKPLLSDREMGIARLVTQGFHNREIGERMLISEQTVKNHLYNIYNKLGVSDRLELALYAVHHRWFDGS